MKRVWCSTSADMPTIGVASVNTKKFRATIEKAGGVGSWSRIILPFDVEKSWGARGRLAVKGRLNGANFQSSAMPLGDGKHFMVVNKALREAAGAAIGDTVQIEMLPDTAPRAVDLVTATTSCGRSVYDVLCIGSVARASAARSAVAVSGDRVSAR